MIKNAYLVILAVLVFSCINDDSGPVDTTLTGKWKLTAAFISAGGPQYWVDVEKGEEWVFFEDGTFNSTSFEACTEGTFNLEAGQLSLEYSCDGFESPWENDQGAITYQLEFGSGYFIVTPISGPICIEGCSYKYEKR